MLTGRKAALALIPIAMACLLGNGCRSAKTSVVPSIEFTVVPESSPGGPSKFAPIEGRVAGSQPGQRLVLYAKSGTWWVQPFAAQPITTIQPDSKWQSLIHLGNEYAALLVDSNYVPEPSLPELPAPGGGVIAVARVKGKGYVPEKTEKTISFSGYDWEASHVESTRGGKPNTYLPVNAWTDGQGALHLRVARHGNEWTCAEVRLKRSLGRGTYVFTVRDVSRMDPAAVLTLYTWDVTAEAEQHRELDVEVSKWGDPASKNAQYVIQPYYEPSNVVRFDVPAGPATFSFNWEPHRVAFKTIRGDAGGGGGSRVLSEHVFTSGVPSPGGESIQINLYAFGNTRIPMQNGSEVVIEKFEYLP